MKFQKAYLLLLALTTSGCAVRQDPGYFLAQSSVVQSQKQVVEAEVTQSPRYQEIRQKIKSVAIAQPDKCENKSASQVTGTASSQGTTVGTKCGVEMADLERALVRQGFNVMSWNMMDNRVLTKDIVAGSDRAAIAKKIGAQILFQVNSLERVNIRPALNAHVENEYYDSNAQGELIKPASITKQRADTIKNVLKSNANNVIKNSTLPGAMLDIHAVDVETGQAIWFYRGTMSDSSSRSTEKNTLLWCYHDTNCYVLRPEEPVQQKGKNIESEVVDISFSAQPASQTDLTYFELLRSVTADFAKKFQTAEK